MNKMLLQNQVRCKKCGDEPYSKHRHDFVSCKCGAVSVDGGMDYIRRVGDLNGYTEMSYWMNEEIVKDCMMAVHDSRKTGRNDLGIVLAVIRALKAHGSVIVET